MDLYRSLCCRCGTERHLVHAKVCVQCSIPLPPLRPGEFVYGTPFTISVSFEDDSDEPVIVGQK